MEELHEYFGNFCKQKVLNKMMKEADIDKDGKISFDDFMTMMKKYLDTSAHIKKIK